MKPYANHLKTITFGAIILFTIYYQYQLRGQSNMKNWKKYSDAVCQVTYPPTWSINTVGLKGPSFILYAPEAEKNGGFKNNINFISAPVPNTEMILQQYIQQSEMSINSSFSDAQILESKTTKTEKETYHQLIYTGSSRGFNLKFYQRLWLVNGKSHILTLSSLANDYDPLSKDVEKIFSAFKLK
jgi:hypothetical protein